MYVIVQAMEVNQVEQVSLIPLTDVGAINFYGILK